MYMRENSCMENGKEIRLGRFLIRSNQQHLIYNYNGSKGMESLGNHAYI